MITQQTKEIVKATAPVLAEHGATITSVFYKRLFVRHPELKNMFNMTHQKKGTQPKVLAQAVFMYAQHIDNLEVLGATVEMIAQKHVSLSVTRPMYAIVGENLLAAIQEVLGAAATPAIMEAWTEAYQFLADILASREEDLYVEGAQQTGGFRGKEAFVVVKKVAESSIITSFYLQRANDQPLPSFKPGQYIALTVDIPSTNHQHTRNYSLSAAPNPNYWRISVKRETGNPDGVVSSYLHQHLQEGDILQVGMPAGDFFLQEDNKPVVLLAGGVGITPLMSMYQQLTAQDNRKVTFIQCAVNGAVQAFAQEIKDQSTSNSTHRVLFSEPLETDIMHQDYEEEGFLTTATLATIPNLQECTFYCCGPKAFMAHCLQLLNIMGISNTSIHYEFFGPMEEMETSV
ncbi:MAG: NO-inducible flavohemoprotein [Aureispira sp.]